METACRTRDPDLGKVVLYQLSYFRILIAGAKVALFIVTAKRFYKKNQLYTVISTPL